MNRLHLRRTPRPLAPPTRSRRSPSKQSLFDDPAFAKAYRAAYSTIYDRNDYAAAIDELKALGHDDHPNVANLIGYSYRKLGDYKLSQVWYERALKSDPNHVLTWNYYGLWQIEQGNRDQAVYHLSRIAAICGTDCAEYRSLAEALEKPPGTGSRLLSSLPEAGGRVFLLKAPVSCGCRSKSSAAEPGGSRRCNHACRDQPCRN